MDSKLPWTIVSSFGIGDTWLIAERLDAFSKKNGGPVQFVVKRAHVPIAEMFCGADSIGILDGEIAPGTVQLAPKRGIPFYAHPSTAPVRPDFCVAAGQMTDAAMYSLILGLHPKTRSSRPPLVRQEWRDEAEAFAAKSGLKKGKTVAVFPVANSLPGRFGDFWPRLAAKISAHIGCDAWFNDPAALSLGAVIPFVEWCGWAIGANSGIMQMIVSGADCRKTVLTPEIDPAGYPLPISGALPYRLMRNVIGEERDIEEYEVGAPHLWDELISTIANGRNARGPQPPRGRIDRIEVGVTPGELVDRYAILCTKSTMLPTKAWSFVREIAALRRQINELSHREEVALYLGLLVEANVEAWYANSRLIETFDGTYALDQNWGIDRSSLEDTFKAAEAVKAFAKAHEANKKRVRLKNELNEIFGNPQREEKQYN